MRYLIFLWCLSGMGATLTDSVQDREPGLRPGTEKQIQWASAVHVKTRLGLAYIHGFSASRDEIAPTLEGLGQNIFFTRLTGHGKDGVALAQATPADWQRDADEAVAVAESIGERPVLIASSMGAMLALSAALRHPRVAGVVLIAPFFGPKDKKAKVMLYPGGLRVAKLFNGPLRKWEPKNPEQARIWTTAYPLEAAKHALELSEAVKRENISALEAPSLTLYTDKDETVDVSEILKHFDRLGGRKQLLLVDKATEHVLAGAATCPQTVPLVRSYIQSFLAGL